MANVPHSSLGKDVNDAMRVCRCYSVIFTTTLGTFSLRYPHETFPKPHEEKPQPQSADDEDSVNQPSNTSAICTTDIGGALTISTKSASHVSLSSHVSQLVSCSEQEYFLLCGDWLLQFDFMLVGVF